jgi:hypothetical protein
VLAKFERRLANGDLQRDETAGFSSHGQRIRTYVRLRQPPVYLTGGAITHAKLAASSVLPRPFHFATCG